MIDPKYSLSNNLSYCKDDPDNLGLASYVLSEVEFTACHYEPTLSDEDAIIQLGERYAALGRRLQELERKFNELV
jgi:hypothetical protein